MENDMFGGAILAWVKSLRRAGHGMPGQRHGPVQGKLHPRRGAEIELPASLRHRLRRERHRGTDGRMTNPSNSRGLNSPPFHAFLDFLDDFCGGYEVQDAECCHLIAHIVALRAKILGLGNVNASIAAALGLRILEMMPRSDTPCRRRARSGHESCALSSALGPDIACCVMRPPL